MVDATSGRQRASSYRLNYNYDEKYLFEFNIRHDGTSKFRRNNMWKTFPSFSLGWNIAHENFWKPLENTVNTLKLRASYGSLGNQNIDNWYQTYSTVDYKSVSGTWLQGVRRPTLLQLQVWFLQPWVGKR